MTFSSARLEFRPIAIADIVSITALHHDPRVLSLLVDAAPDTLTKASAMVHWNQELAVRGYGTFAVRRRSEGALLGLFSLTPFQGDESLLELGGRLAPAAWVGGLALEAGAAMIEHAFGTLDREDLVSAFHPDHRAAPAALARLGFVASGNARLFGQTVKLMALSRTRWRAQGSRPQERTRSAAPPKRPGYIQDGLTTLDCPQIDTE